MNLFFEGKIDDFKCVSLVIFIIGDDDKDLVSVDDIEVLIVFFGVK